MNRKDVYAAIDTERDFQIEMSKNPHRPDMVSQLSMGDTITAIQFNLRKVTNAWYREAAPYPCSMDFIRKIAALCVQAGENHGMAPRETSCNKTPNIP